MNIFKLHTIILLLVVFSGCSSGSKTVTKEKEISQKNLPSWVVNRPIVNQYYIGIGIANKEDHGTEYIQSAKNNALNDIASEISVNIESKGFLTTIEHSYKFDSEYNELIKSTTKQNLEGYELVAAHDDGSKYYVYYRLDKLKWNQLQRDRKQKAMVKALDFYKSGQVAVQENKIIEGFNYYLNGLLEIKNYWDELNEIDFDGQNIILDNAIYSSLNELLSGIRINSEKELIFNVKNDFSSNLKVNVSNLKGTSIYNIPLSVKYRKAEGKFEKTYNSSQSGEVDLSVTSVSKKKAVSEMDIKVDVKGMYQNYKNDVFAETIISNLKSANVQVILKVEKPIVFIVSTEKVNGVIKMNNYLKNAAAEILSEKGFKIASDSTEADVVLTIKGDTKGGQSYSNFKVSYLDYSVEVFDKLTSKVVGTKSVTQIKGVALDHEKASVTAYEEAVKSFESKCLRGLIKKL